MHIIITMIRIPLLARRPVGKLSLTTLLPPPPPPPFFLYFRTDGWSSTASPTTPSCLYIFHVVESTRKCALSLGCRYFQRLGLKCADYHILMLCTTLFHFIILQPCEKFRHLFKCIIINISTHEICSVFKMFFFNLLF